MSGSGTWRRRWLVLYRVTSDRWSRRWFGSHAAAVEFAESVREAGGTAEVQR